ncbi:hypothetical protein BH24GEM3_BH24GEM3_03020 [soil metagenome]
MLEASPFLVWSFAALAVLVGAAFPLGLSWADRRLGRSLGAARTAALLAALGTVLWMGLTLAAAATGRLAFGTVPPPMMILFVLILALGIGVGLSPVGERLAMGLPLAVLVGVQGFRLPLELLMHRAYTEGVMPEQMSYSGYNFDIVTGITALLVAGMLLAGRMPLWGVRVWNWMGFLLLVNVVMIAWLSTPIPLRVFMNEPANVWITHPPFVWLPTVLVLTALLGHIVIFRRLRMERTRGMSPRAASHPEPRRMAVP